MSTGFVRLNHLRWFSLLHGLLVVEYNRVDLIDAARILVFYIVIGSSNYSPIFIFLTRVISKYILIHQEVYSPTEAI